MTSNYTRKAVDKYQAKFDRTSIRLPMGTIDQIKDKYPDISINQYINNLINQDLNKSDLHNNLDLSDVSEYRPNVTESSRTNENEFDDKIIDNDIKIDSRAFKKHVPTEEEETDNRMRLLKLQEEINARKTCIIKHVEQEPTMTDIKLPDKPPF